MPKRKYLASGCGVALAIFSITAFGAIDSPLPPQFVQEQAYESEDGNTVVRVYRSSKEPLGPMQVKVFPNGKSSSSGDLVWTGQNRAWVLVSPHGQSIAINQHAMSDLGLLYVFSRRPDGTYRKIDVDFQAEALRLFSQQDNLANVPQFDHIYCYAKTWLTDDKFLGMLSGHQSGAYSLNGFWFIFDCSTRKFFFDLSELNRRAIQGNK